MQHQQLQASLGASTQIMTKCDIASLYSFYNLEDIILGNHNRRDEGYAVVPGVMINEQVSAP